MEQQRKRRIRQKPNKEILSRTLFVMVVCGMLMFIVLGARLYKVQVKDHERYESMAIQQQTQEVEVSASRGTVYDTNGNVLAMSATAYNVFLSPYEIVHYKEDPGFIAENLAEILQTDVNKILQKTENTDSWYETVAWKIDPELADAVRQFKSDNNLMGVHLEESNKRYYPYSSLACQIIGFTGDDGYGLEGIEAGYDHYLEGTDGKVVRLKSADGTDVLFQNYEYYYDAENGDDLNLTIDVNIQNITERHLAQAIADNDVLKGGCAIVMDVNDGAILGMASFENYDLNNYLQVSEKVQKQIEAAASEEEKSTILRNAQFAQWRNKSLSDTYEPGSVFKIITLAIGLEEGIVGLQDSFYCGGNVEVLGRDDPLNCWKLTGHGQQTLAEAMQHSCNCALVDIGLSIGAETSWKYYKAFGLFDDTGVDLAGEASSIWWNKDVFCDPTNYSQLAAASFGQTFTVTPLQMITAVAAACNGGYLLKPYVVKSAVAPDGTVEYANGRTVVRQVISNETSKTVCEILESVVSADGGTGANAYVPGYRIAGKTGTSEKVAQDVAGGKKEYVVSFCSFAPADDPKIAILLILDTPSDTSGRYISGGNMCAPAVGAMNSEILSYLGVEPIYTEGEQETLDISVPYVTDLSVEQATKEIEQLGLSIRVVGNGTNVTAQLPIRGSKISKNSTVILYTKGNAPNNMVTMPDLSGMDESAAVSALEEIGLYMQKSGAVTDNYCTVQGQSVAKGEKVLYGTVISVSFINTSIQGQY